MKQWVRIPKTTWTLSNVGRRLTCWTSFSKVSLMKDDVNDEIFNGTPQTLILFDGVLNWDGVSKSSDRLERDHVTHF